jgi:hypothetical protein
MPSLLADFMTNVESLNLLAQWLSGEFSNQEQAFNEPAWFVKLRLWHRPVPIRLNSCLAIFAEQANAMYPDQSYRQRVFVLQDKEGILQAQYFGFKQPERFRGAGMKPELLSALALDDLMLLPGCLLRITRNDDASSGMNTQRFVGRMLAGDRCRFHYDGKVGQVILGFDVQENRFWSYDKGVNPDTEQPIWGALMGPYAFVKTEDFSSSLPL